MNDLNPQLEKMFESARRVALTRAEKDMMRTQVEAFVRAHPAGKGGIISPWMGGWTFAIVRSPIALALILVLAAGSGTAYAAEGALPGDALYAVKVHVVEEAVGAVAFSDEARVRWEETRAERRLAEAQVLAERGTLTPERRAEIEERFEQHSLAVETRAKAIEARGEKRMAVALLAEFETKLEARHALLAREDARREKHAPREAAAIARNAAPAIFMAKTELQPTLLTAPEIDTASSTVSGPIDTTEHTETGAVAEMVRTRIMHVGVERRRAEKEATQEGETEHAQEPPQEHADKPELQGKRKHKGLLEAPDSLLSE